MSDKTKIKQAMRNEKLLDDLANNLEKAKQLLQNDLKDQSASKYYFIVWVRENHNFCPAKLETHNNVIDMCPLEWAKHNDAIILNWIEITKKQHDRYLDLR
jgi:hypothetical protein